LNKIKLMKKVFLLFATVTLLVGFQACKSGAEKPAEATTEEVATDTPVVDVTPAALVDSDTSRLPKTPPDPTKP
jgi:hypothetical protein